MSNPQKIFSKIYDQYVEKIYRFIFLKVNSQEIAEDLTSETFLKGWQAFKKFQNPTANKQKIENIQAFLYQIARNLVIDYYREKGRAQVISTEYVPINDPRNNLEEKALLNSDIDRVRQVLANLKEESQAIIIWHYLNDLSIPEIARIMEKPEGTIRVMLHRAIKELKSKFSEI